MGDSANRYNIEEYVDQCDARGGVAVEQSIPLQSFTLFGYDTMVSIDPSFIHPLYGWDNPQVPLDGSAANEGSLLCMCIGETSDQGAHFDHQTTLDGQFVGGGDEKTLKQPMLLVGIKHRVYRSGGGAVVPLSKTFVTFQNEAANAFTVNTTAALQDATANATSFASFYWTWHDIGDVLTNAQRRLVVGGTTMRLRIGLDQPTNINGGYYQILGVRLRYRKYLTLPTKSDRQHRYQ